MTNEELRLYRAKLFRDASSLERKPEKIPHMSFFVTWKILDAGYKLSEAMNDYDIMEKVVRRHQEKYGFDCILEMGARNAIRIPMALGNCSYYVNDEAGTVNYVDKSICEHDELRELAAGVKKFFWEKGMARKYDKWANGTVTLEDMQKVVDEQTAFMQYMGRISQIMQNEYALPPYAAPRGYGYIGLDFMFNTVRGIRGLSIDMRKDKGALQEACAALNEIYYKPGIDALRAAPVGPAMHAAFDYDLTLLCHTILNNKQFAEYLWPFMKETLDVLAEKKMTVRLFMEGSSKRFWSYFKDVPKGVIVMHPEQDDVFELRKELPNVAILGGMPVSLLGTGTKEQCVERVRRLFEELGKDGGFMLTQDKMVSFRNDANPENVKAVCDFVREYNG